MSRRAAVAPKAVTLTVEARRNAKPALYLRTVLADATASDGRKVEVALNANSDSLIISRQAGGKDEQFVVMTEALVRAVLDFTG